MIIEQFRLYLDQKLLILIIEKLKSISAHLQYSVSTFFRIESKQLNYFYKIYPRVLFWKIAFLTVVTFASGQNNSMIQGNDRSDEIPSAPNNLTIPVSFTKITQGVVVSHGGISTLSNWIDYDNDGYLDLFVLNFEHSNNDLYHNNHDATFTKITTGALINDGSNSLCSCWGDYDNDGYSDLYIANWWQTNLLYRNNGDGTFSKITTGSIADYVDGSSGCAWGDYDNDGYIDLFVANRQSVNNLLYHNNGDGTFTQVMTGSIVNDGGNSFGCSWADYNNDGYLDLFVANGGWDEEENDFLYRNQGDGTFAKITSEILVNDGGKSFGGSWGDYDRDGDLDLFVAAGKPDLGRLYQNNGDGSFTKITTGSIANEENIWVTGWIDFDNDGDLDLYAIKDCINGPLFENNGDGTFTKITTGDIVNDPYCTRDFSWGDFDHDGDVDLFLPKNDHSNSLFVNNGNDNNWIDIHCIGTLSNRLALGAKVRVKAKMNGDEIWQLHEVSGQTSGGGGSRQSLNARFGLGNATIIDSIKIEWPSGTVEAFGNIPVNQFLTIKEKEDIEAPVIGATGSDLIENCNTPVRISVPITDNRIVQQACLFYRQGGEKSFQSFIMNETGGIYQGQIPDSAVTSRGVEYYIEARDSSLNSARTDLKCVRVRLPENHLQFNQQGGQTADAYRLISFPLEMDDPSVASVLLDDLGQPDSLNWRLWDIDPRSRTSMFPYREFPDITDMGPGKAKFLITRESLTLTSEPGVTVNSIAPFEIELQQGWNMIGSPFNFPITHIEPESLRVHLNSYEGQWIPNPDTLNPCQGYMIKVSEPVTLSLLPSGSESDQYTSVSKSFNMFDWTIRIEASCGQAVDNENRIGVIKDADLEWDQYELFEPPPIGQFIMLSFPHREWRSFPDIHSTDFRPPFNDGCIWDFEVLTNIPDQQVTLTFDHLAAVPSEYKVILIDPDFGVRQDLRDQPEYQYGSFKSGQSKRLNLVVGNPDFIKTVEPGIVAHPETYELYQNFPNPFNPITTIKYGIPQPCQISLSIYNILGQEIKTLIDGKTAQAGYQTVLWNGRDNRGQPTPNGIYFIRLKTGEVVLTRKMTLLK